MPQVPFQVDQVQIEPGSGDVLLINRDSSGSLLFTDTQQPSGIRLQDLVGIGNIGNLYIVGKTNAPYSTIQQAIDSIPDASTDTHVVLVTVGVYTEDIVITKDNVYLYGLGASIVSDVGSCISLQVSETSVPKKCTIKNLYIKNVNNNKSCVEVLGANQFASGTLTIDSAPLVAGDTITINGVTLIGVNGTRTSGGNDFSVVSGLPNAIAIEITEALNDSLNNFVGFIKAEVVGTVITITSILPGSIGNTYTLVTTSAFITLSGPTLLGGSSSGSEVGSQFIDVMDCTLESTGTNSYHLYADTINYVSLTNVVCRGSVSTSGVSVNNVSLLTCDNVQELGDVTLTYNNTLDRPSDITSLYTFQHCTMNDVTINLVGVGDTVFKFCTLKNLDVNGDGTVTLRHSDRSVGTYTGTPTVLEDTAKYTATFTNVSLVTVNFDFPRPNTNYVVLLDTQSPTIVAGCTTRNLNSFVIETNILYTGTVNCLIKE